MMNYEMFKELFSQKITDYMPEEYKDRKIALASVDKINQKRDALTFMVTEEDIPLSPNLYLDSLYEEYLYYEDIEPVLQKAAIEMCKHLEKGMHLIDKVRIEEMKDHIIFQVINTEQNREYLENLPHREYQDLSIIYRWLLQNDENGISSAVINNQLAEHKGISESELFFYATQNTRELAPIMVKPLHLIVDELVSGEDISFDLQEAIEQGIDLDESMVVITNEMKSFGAASILYGDVLQDVAKLFQSDFYLLPSSIHEMLAIAVSDNTPDPATLADMVREINESQVEIGERLSNQVYHYDAQTRKLSMATDTPYKKLDHTHEEKVLPMDRAATR